MYIAANIDDCALVINDFLPPDLFKKISEYDYSLLDTIDSYKDWEKKLFADSKGNITLNSVKTTNGTIANATGNKIESKNDLFKNFFKILMDCPFIPYQVNSELKLSYYEYDKFAGINWHDDRGYTLNYSFYIHNEWDVDWGGETLIDTGRGLPLSTIPVPNSMLVVKSKIRHKVCAIVGPEKRRVLQVRGNYYK